ncbi:diguanylate cyclase [Ancylobacter sp. WKF20]|uniref:GGDEF domain-containing protein n=1 Tax=Ancylobacter sp. WKF20 TaxID=3039801 RepID=UPI00243441FB|nr:diguanylate cyclase [Ancylobacter sp. WKF20]WGD31820.1 diguanylate cyclase [Ancylobacter sp. WKF20]
MLAHISAEDLRRIYLDFPIASCVIGRDGRVLAHNREFADVVPTPGGDVAGRYVADVFGAVVMEATARTFAAFDQGAQEPQQEIGLFGRVFIAAVRPLRDEAGEVTAICAALTEITEQKRLETRLESANRELQAANRRLAEAASTDALTGLWNRHALEELLPREILRCRREKAPLSVLLVDIDDFKKYNDRYGHLAGDDTLHAVAQVMAGVLRRPGDMIARFGGEEFIVVLPGTAAAGAIRVAESLHKAVESLAIEHASIAGARLSISVGAACFSLIPANTAIGEIRSMLIERADQALYAVKAEGGRGIRLHWDGGSLPSSDGQLLPAR